MSENVHTKSVTLEYLKAITKVIMTISDRELEIKKLSSEMAGDLD